jgi:5-hydroxyisourate hydrolase
MISTHVLDTQRGEPRAALKVCLYRGDRLLSDRRTNEDGRVPELAPAPLEPGEYRLVFELDGAFFHRVELTLSITEPDRHYHVPLLVAPFSCTVYRGS